MPNVKLFADETLPPGQGMALRAALPDLRALLCRDLGVKPAACQIALLPVTGLEGQPPVNVEMLIMPGASRTPEAIRALAKRIRALLSPCIGGSGVAVRIGMLDARNYVALK